MAVCAHHCDEYTVLHNPAAFVYSTCIGITVAYYRGWEQVHKYQRFGKNTVALSRIIQPQRPTFHTVTHALCLIGPLTVRWCLPVLSSVAGRCWSSAAIRRKNWLRSSSCSSSPSRETSSSLCTTSQRYRNHTVWRTVELMDSSDVNSNN